MLNDIGKASINKNKEYPLPGHPKIYDFRWETGRIPDEYQFLLIVEGAGIFENEPTGKIRINQGDGF
jgi:hypothetical protein